MNVIPYEADTNDADFMHRFNHIYQPAFSKMHCNNCREESTLTISADGKNSSGVICCNDFKEKVFTKMEYLSNVAG
jgi:hypothetical protein